MLTLVVPVISKSVTLGWIGFVQSLEKTIRSISTQMYSNFSIGSICSEIPEVYFAYKNLHLIHPGFQQPLNENIGLKIYVTQQRIDTDNKIKFGVVNETQ